MRRFNQVKQVRYSKSWDDFDNMDDETYYEVVNVNVVNDFIEHLSF